LKRDGAAVDTSGGFNVAMLASVVGKRGFSEAIASSGSPHGFGGTKADKEAANGLGDAAGGISFPIVPAVLGKANGEFVVGAVAFSIGPIGLGKAKGEVFAVAPTFSAISVGFGNVNGEVVAGASAFSTVSAGLEKANGDDAGGVPSLAAAVAPGLEKTIEGPVEALSARVVSAGVDKANGEGEGEGLAANGFAGADAGAATLLAGVPENMAEKGFAACGGAASAVGWID
jgi:hypothetical protein